MKSKSIQIRHPSQINKPLNCLINRQFTPKMPHQKHDLILSFCLINWQYTPKKPHQKHNPFLSFCLFHNASLIVSQSMFLVACTRLYNPFCLSVCLSVGRLVDRSVGRSVTLYFFSPPLPTLTRLRQPCIRPCFVFNAIIPPSPFFSVSRS